jgi:hypothetical protein
MQYLREVLASLQAETILGQGEAVLSNPDADEADRLEAALALRKLRVRIFGQGNERGLRSRPKSGG